MTVADMIEEVFDNLGRPTIVNPYIPGTTTLDTSSRGYSIILRELNKAQRRVARWIDPVTGKSFLFRSLINQIRLDYSPLEITITDVGDDTLSFFLDASYPTDAPPLWFSIQVGSNVFPVLGLSGDVDVVAEVSGDVSTVSPGASATLHSGVAFVGPTPSGYDSFNTPGLSMQTDTPVLFITDAEGVVLRRRDEPYLKPVRVTGIPRAWTRLNDTIVFDKYFSECTLTFVVYTLPQVLSNTTDSPELPEVFHDVIVMIATRALRKRYLGDYDGAYVDKQDITDYMRSVKDTWAEDYIYEDIQMVYEDTLGGAL